MWLRELSSVILSAALLTTAVPVALAGNGNGKGNGAGNSHAEQNAGNHGNSDSAPGKNKGDGTATTKSQSTVRQYVVANNLKQGDVAKLLKSWNALNANPNAFANALDNPDSLLGKQAAYVCDQASATAALADFTAAGGNAGDPPTAEEAAAASAYIAAQALLTDLDPQTVADNLEGTYSPEQVAAANLLLTSSLDSATASQTLTLYGQWQDYQAAAQQADASFVTASVSYKQDADLTALRQTVDGVIAHKGLDMNTICSTEVATTE